MIGQVTARVPAFFVYLKLSICIFYSNYFPVWAGSCVSNVIMVWARISSNGLISIFLPM